MRYIGLDLGTKTLGVAITDKTNTFTRTLKVIHFPENDYELALSEVGAIIKEFNITKIALGLPKNMNNSLGYASKRSLDFKKELESQYNIPVFMIDERLSTVEAESILINADMSRGKRKKVIDGVAAEIILDTFLKLEEKKNE